MVNSYRNSTSIIFYGNGIVFINRNDNMGTITCQCFVDRVIHNFIYQMVKSSHRGTSNIHSRSLSYCFQTFQNLNLVCSVFRTHLYSSYSRIILHFIFFTYCSAYDFKYFINLEAVSYKFIQTGTGNDRLNIMYTVKQIILPVTVQFRKHII